MKKSRGQNPWSVPVPLFLKFVVSILLNENRTKGENKIENIYEQKRKGEEIIVVTTSRRRAMKELGRATFPLTPRPVVAHHGPAREEGLPREEDSTYKT